MDTDVVIAGAGPNGLLTACELALAGVRAVVLERLRGALRSQRRANGLVGRVVQALDQRVVSTSALGGSGVPLTPVPHFQVRCAGSGHGRVLADHCFLRPAHPAARRRWNGSSPNGAAELGVEIRRGHEFVRRSEQGRRTR